MSSLLNVVKGLWGGAWRGGPFGTEAHHGQATARQGPKLILRPAVPGNYHSVTVRTFMCLALFTSGGDKHTNMLHLLFIV